MLRWIGPLLGVAVAACSDPTLDVTVAYEPGLRSHLAAVSLSVLVVDDATGAPATCAQVEFGELSPAVLEGGRRAVTSALDAPHLAGVPRLGPKLIVLDGRDPTGRRIAGGCTELGDVSDDTVIAVTAMIAPRVRAIARADAAPLQVYAVEPWPNGGPIDGRAVHAEVRGGAGQVALAAPYPTTERGVATLPPLTLGGHGPQQTVVRVSWAEPFVVPGLRLWPEILDGAGATFEVDTATRNGRYDPSWVVRVQPPWAAYGLNVRVDEPEVVGIHHDAGVLVREPPVPAPGVRAIVGWSAAIYSVVAGLGWVRLDPGAAGFAASGGSAPGAGAATELVAIDGCAGGGGAGLLVLRPVAAGDDRIQAWTGYDRPGTLAPAGSALAVLAAALNGGAAAATVGHVAGQGCAMGKKVVAIRRPDLVLVAYIVDDPVPRALPIVSAFSALGRTGAGLVGVTVTITGPRVVSFAPTRIGMLDLFIANDVVDTEVAGVAASIAITALTPDGDGAAANDSRDVIAALGGSGVTRLQVSLQDRQDGMPAQTWSVSGISDAIAGDDPRLRLDDVDGDGKDELVVLTSASARVFRLVP